MQKNNNKKPKPNQKKPKPFFEIEQNNFKITVEGDKK